MMRNGNMFAVLTGVFRRRDAPQSVPHDTLRGIRHPQVIAFDPGRKVTLVKAPDGTHTPLGADTWSDLYGGDAA